MNQSTYETIGTVHGVLVTRSPSGSYYGRTTPGETHFLISLPEFTSQATSRITNRVMKQLFERLENDINYPLHTSARDLGITKTQLSEILDFCRTHHNMNYVIATLHGHQITKSGSTGSYFAGDYRVLKGVGIPLCDSVYEDILPYSPWTQPKALHKRLKISEDQLAEIIQFCQAHQNLSS